VNWLAIGFFMVSWACILPPVLAQQRGARANTVGFAPGRIS
jgi:hypothetical protein